MTFCAPAAELIKVLFKRKELSQPAKAERRSLIHGSRLGSDGQINATFPFSRHEAWKKKRRDLVLDEIDGALPTFPPGGCPFLALAYLTSPHRFLAQEEMQLHHVSDALAVLSPSFFFSAIDQLIIIAQARPVLFLVVPIMLPWLSSSPPSMKKNMSSHPCHDSPSLTHRPRLMLGARFSTVSMGGGFSLWSQSTPLVLPSLSQAVFFGVQFAKHSQQREGGQGPAPYPS